MSQGVELDLNGETHTITADTTEQWWRVTDTSTAKDGTVLLEAGAKLLFDDQAIDGVYPGFDPAWVGTLTVQGTSEHFCEIRSVDQNPHYPFLMALGATGNIAGCRIAGNGSYSCTNLTAIILNTVYFGYASYCGVDDVRRLTGITTDLVADADISELIAMAVADVDDFTGRRWYTGTALNEDHDYWGEEFLKTTNYPIQSVTSLSHRSGETFSAKTWGPEADYYASPDDLKQGMIRLITTPPEDYQAVRVSYTYGEAVTAGTIRRLTALLAGRDALLSSQTPQKVGAVRERIGLFDSEVKRIRNQLGGKLRPYDSAGRNLERRTRVSDIMRWRY
jgi:hypothetical protein